MHYTVKTATTIKFNLWEATIHARADVTVVPDGDGRKFELSNIAIPNLQPIDFSTELEAVEKITEALQKRAAQYLSGDLALHDVLELAEVTQPTGHWRLCPHALGWVQGLENQYHGVLLATNGILGITRCNDLQFRSHQMSKWSKRRSRITRPKDDDEDDPTPRKRQPSREEIEAAALELLGL